MNADGTKDFSMNRQLDLLGLPSLPERAFVKDAAGKIKPQGKGGSSAPKPPDYTAMAEATAKGNLDLAKYTTQANRINQYTPWGSLTYTNDRTFDQNAYDAAMNAYNNQAGKQTSAPYEDRSWMGGAAALYGSPATLKQQQQQSYLPPPNAEDFWSGGDSWSQHVQLSPELQAQLDQQNKLAQGMFGAQDAALNRVNETLGQGFDTSRLPEAGTALNSSGLTGWGDLGNVLNTSRLPGMGTALDMNSLPEMGQAFQASGEALDIYDPELQTNNATELLLSRINPQLDQQQEALRSQLANQGIVQGTEAYDRAMMQHQQGRNDAYNQAALSGIGLGMQQQGMMFDQNLANRGLLAGEADLMYGHQQGLRHGEAGLQNQQFQQQQNLRQLEAALQAQQFAQQNQNAQILAQRRAQEAAEQAQQFGQQQGLRGNAFQEEAYLRNLPLQELGALTGNAVQMPQFPGYSQQAQTAGPDYLGAGNQQYQAQLGSWNAQQAQQQQAMQGMGGLGGAVGSIFGGPIGGLVGSVGGSLLGGLFG